MKSFDRDTIPVENLASRPIYASVASAKIEIRELNHDGRLFCDKMVLVLGHGDTGKTTMAKYILRLLDDYIQTAICITQTKLNGTYKHMLPDSRIRTYNPSTPEVTADGIFRFSKSQAARTAMYTYTCDLDILTKIYNCHKIFIKTKYPKWHARFWTEYLRYVEQKRVLDHNPALKPYQKKQLLDPYRNILSTLLRDVFSRIRGAYSYPGNHARLSADHRRFFDLLELNPRGLLLMDDCMIAFRKINTIRDARYNNIITNMVVNGRHSHITFLALSQDDKALPNDIRDNVHVMIFMSHADLAGFARKITNVGDPETKLRWLAMAGEIFQIKYRAMVVYKRAGLPPIIAYFSARPQAFDTRLQLTPAQWRDSKSE